MSSKREDEIREALESIRAANGGRLTRDVVVRAARNARHTLHREFNWNDKTEAHRARLERAGELIARYVTVTVIHKSRKVVAPYYVKDPRVPTNEPGYVPLTSEELKRQHAMQIIVAEIDRISSHIERARDIAAVLDSVHPGMSDQFQRMLEELVLMKARLAA